MDNEAQLIEETLNGECQAFGQLVRRYQKRLYNTIVQVIGSHEDAEDIVQDAFVQAFAKLESFRGRSSFYTWLYRIAFNYSISKLRRKKEVLVDYNEDPSLQPFDGGDAPDGRLLREERSMRVRAAWAALSEEHRAILVLRELEDCRYEDISEILDLPIGTVRSRIHRARSEMREDLKDLYQISPAD